MEDRITIAPAEECNLDDMAPRMREADVLEIYSSHLIRPFDALMEGFASGPCWVALSGGRTLCAFGVAVASISTGTANPWMLGTDEIEAHAREFLVKGKKIVDGWAGTYPVLFNYVDARNKKAIRWLRWLGFSLYEPEPYGALGMPFHRFSMGVN